MQYRYVLQIDLGNGVYSVTDGYLDVDGCLDLMSFKNKELKPERIIFQNNHATIVYWNDGTKTVVKTTNDDKFDPEVGFAMALVKRIYGNRSEVLRWIENAEIKE